MENQIYADDSKNHKILGVFGQKQGVDTYLSAASCCKPLFTGKIMTCIQRSFSLRST